MFNNSIRRLTPIIVERSKYNFDVLWSGGKYMVIELNEKPCKNIWETIPDYDKDVNPNLHSSPIAFLETSKKYTN
jgi:hypothetical protein|tara:strand:- start:442 stop:666 length:225 start_codon:yes stop_codon:yes gene_type:complete